MGTSGYVFREYVVFGENLFVKLCNRAVQLTGQFTYETGGIGRFS